MQSRLRYSFVTVALITAIFFPGPPAAQAQTIRANTPGRAFAAQGPVGRLAVDDVAGGRRYRGEVGQTLIVQAPIQMPASALADKKVERLAVHFRASRNGP